MESSCQEPKSCPTGRRSFTRSLSTVITRFASVCLLLAAPLLTAGEIEERGSIQRLAGIWFARQEYGDLDKWADEYRRTESRTSSGLWKLTILYAGINGSLDETMRDERYWTTVESQLRRWAAQNPGSPTPHIAYAMKLISHGWHIRGSGWSSEVKEENWKPFHQYVEKARVYLVEHKSVAAADPRWYETMLDVANAQGWERKEFDALVDEAASRHPFFYQIYFTALDYLLPKWHGDRDEIEEFAQFAVNKTRDVEGMGMYARIYWYAAQNQYGASLFTESAVVWTKMKRGMDDVLARYPDQWNINNFAAFACLKGDKQKTRELLNRIEGAPIPSAWYDDLGWFERCKASVQ